MRNGIMLAVKLLGIMYMLRLRIDDSTSVNSACGLVTVSVFAQVSASFVLVSILLSHVCMQCNENSTCLKCSMIITFIFILIGRSRFHV